MSKDTIKNYYEDKHTRFGISGDRLKKTLPLIQNISKRKILDIGCSSGFLTKYLVGRGNHITGMDISQKSISEAKQYLDKAYVMDIETVSQGKFRNKFDFIIMSEVLEHLFDPDKTFLKVIGWLKPGGQILISTPNFVHIYNRTKILFGTYRYREERLINKSHLHFYTYPTLTELFKNSNVSIVAYNHVIFPRTLAVFWKHWPSLFAHQMVFLCRKNK